MVDGGWRWLCERLLQPACLVCGQRAGWPGWCAGCRADLPAAPARCPRCASSLPAAADQACGACLRRPPPWTCAVAAWCYAWPVDRLVQGLKFQRRPQVAVALAAGLAETLRSRGGQRPLALVPVPLHRWRLAQRGYNQAHEIARALARQLDLPLRAGALRRTRHTAAQSGLAATQRRRNLAGAFRAAGRLPAHVALVDDVMTPGSTLAVCTRTLLRAGARRVDVWVVARAGR
ncbi:MAG: ComF family protein [Xanthomonadales bacterium]|nr:ComF family protein [Xanthomonadales bacterium]